MAKRKVQPKRDAQPKRGKPASRAAEPVVPTMATIAKRVSTRPSKRMETFPNPSPGRDYEIVITYPEFTCLCPMTGQPDFAEIEIAYIPDAVCVELKSLRNYLWSFRTEGVFHEAVTNTIADELIALMQPRWLQVEAKFQARGGLTTAVRVEHAAGAE